MIVTGLGDSHVHTRFSLDSTAEPREVIESAIKKELGWITFTEHKDLYQGHPIDANYHDYKACVENVAAMQRIFAGRIKVLNGVEVDFMSDTADAFHRFTRDHRFDFIIGSVHALDHYFIDCNYFNDKNPREVYRRYLREVLVLSRQDGYDVIGHLDYVTRHAPPDCPLIVSEHRDLISRILDNVIKKGKGIELNSSGWRHGKGQPYPDKDILFLYRQLGGEIITLGSDSHRPLDTGGYFDKAVSLLQNTGFQSVHVFVDRQAVPLPIVPIVKDN